MFFSALPQTFPAALQWATHHGYFLIFLIMVVEGPLITIASAFAASLGYLNVFFIFILAFGGDLVGDFVWYGAGYLTRLAVINKYGHYFGISKARIEKLRKVLERHGKKTLLAIKLSPTVSNLALVAVGNSHFPPKRFAKIVALVSLPKTIIFVFFGYFFGYSYTIVAKYANKWVYGLFAVLLAVFCALFIYWKITKRIAKKLENQL
jgi:membrane protein DedA with SNARE-associated domain